MATPSRSTARPSPPPAAPLAWLAACLVARAGAVSMQPTLRPTSDVAPIFQSFNPQFVAPLLTPPQFLMVSSPSMAKIVYAPLRNFKAVTGRTYALVDSGLVSPRGLAFDRDRGALYVADSGAQKIFRYHVYVENGNDPVNMRLYSDGVQITILQGVPVSWVTVDPMGNVLYSDPRTNAIGKIPVDTIHSLSTGFYHASDLQFLSQTELQSRAAQQAASGSDLSLAETFTESSVVHRLYEGSQSPHVSAPGGVATDGYHLYWTNTANGASAGTVVRGLMQPGEHLQANATFPATPLTTNDDQAFGIAKSATMVVYSSNTSGVGKVFGLFEKTGQVHCLSDNLAEPRGLAWDGDQTVYVADEVRSGVWSLPVGRLADNTPLTQAAVLTGAYGVALLSQKDRAWNIRAGAQGLRGAGRFGGLVALVSAWLALSH